MPPHARADGVFTTDVTSAAVRDMLRRGVVAYSWDAGTPFCEFSNYAQQPFSYNGHACVSGMAAITAERVVEDLAARVRLSPDPRAVLKGKIRCTRPDWGAMKVAVVLRVMRARWACHPQLRDLLLATADARIEAIVPDDKCVEGGVCRAARKF